MRKPSARHLTLSVLTLGLAAGLATAAMPARAATAASSSPAAAAADTVITATYPVTGSTHLARLNTTLALGPGTLSSTLDLTTGALTGSLTLPPSTGSFKELGFVPVTVTTELVPVGQITGTASLANNTVSTTSQALIKINSLKVAGISIPVGNNCETAQPTTIAVNSAAGFNLLTGGTLTGTYSIPLFSHCGLATGLINLSIPGPGNTISLTLGAATLS